ncbi:PDZ domain-containing protein [Candidatus Parcubacteria bacterium]|nr:PDZ domain-containing protein [Candidatus Parcubacteria bacterium]
MKKFLILFFITVVIVISFVFGFIFGQTECEICPPEQVDFSLFWQAWDTLQKRFVNQEEFDTQQMIYGAISGMVKSLEDPYTVFLDPDDTKRFIEDIKGSFEGVGMEIGIRKSQLTVIAPLEGTPAQKAGLRPGDKILKVDETSTIDISIDEAVDLIRGPKGTEVVLLIYREEWENTQEIPIIRQVIKIPSLKLEMLDENIAHLKLYQFSEKARADFRKTANEILQGPAEKIILDLRNNPGGYLEVSQDIAGWFLEQGQIVVIEDFGKAGQKEYLSKGPSRFLDYPLVILINQGSASASEILAGAIRDNRDIKLIGEKSFGKGSVQELERLKQGSSLKITIAKWLTPKGELIADVGLEPDVIIEMTDEDYEQERDPQLEKAIEIIKEIR